LTSVLTLAGIVPAKAKFKQVRSCSISVIKRAKKTEQNYKKKP